MSSNTCLKKVWNVFGEIAIFKSLIDLMAGLVTIAAFSIIRLLAKLRHALLGPIFWDVRRLLIKCESSNREEL